MKECKEFKPANISEHCCGELCRMESELSKTSEKDIVLVAFEKK